MVCRVLSSFRKEDVTRANMEAKTKEIKVRKNTEGQNVGLKNPLQKSRFSSHAPGVSMKSIIPVIMKRDIQAQMK